MADWKFTDDYGTQYPALQSSILSMLSFSDHTISGTDFTGTLDVAASGTALATLGSILNVTSITVSGSVTTQNNTLSISLTTPDHAVFVSGIGANVPLIGSKVSDAWMDITTIAAASDNSDEGPQRDEIDLSVTFSVGTHALTLKTQVPMNGGFFAINGTFQNVGITLDDLSFLMGSLSSDQWFPGQQLGPYNQNQPALSLLSMTLTAYVKLQPFQIQISSVTVVIGITSIPIMNQQLYLNPLAVWVTVTNPLNGPEASWGIEGDLVLCNYARPGDLNNPDFTFEFVLGLTDFSISGQLENPSNQPINVMLQDLLGQGTSVGLNSNLTVNSFSFEAQADKTSGTLGSFSTEIAMSGGFGVFSGFEIEEFSLALDYSS